MVWPTPILSHVKDNQKLVTAHSQGMASPILHASLKIGNSLILTKRYLRCETNLKFAGIWLALMCICCKQSSHVARMWCVHFLRMLRLALAIFCPKMFTYSISYFFVHTSFALNSGLLMNCKLLLFSLVFFSSTSCRFSRSENVSRSTVFTPSEINKICHGSTVFTPSEVLKQKMCHGQLNSHLVK